MRETIEALDLDTGQPIYIDATTVLAELEPMRTAALVYAPRTPIEQPPFREQFIEYWTHGVGIIHTVVAGYGALAAITAIMMIQAIGHAIHSAMLAAQAIIAIASSVMGVVLAILLYMLLCGSRSKSGSISLKGCAHGGTPGSHSIRVGRGGQMFYRGSK